MGPPHGKNYTGLSERALYERQRRAAMDKFDSPKHRRVPSIEFNPWTAQNSRDSESPGRPEVGPAISTTSTFQFGEISLRTSVPMTVVSKKPHHIDEAKIIDKPLSGVERPSTTNKK